MINLFHYETIVPARLEKVFVDFMRNHDDQVWLPCTEPLGYGADNPAFEPYYTHHDGEVVYRNYCAPYGTTARLLNEFFCKNGYPKYAIMWCTVDGIDDPWFQLMQFTSKEIYGVKIVQTVQSRKAIEEKRLEATRRIAPAPQRKKIAG